MQSLISAFFFLHSGYRCDAARPMTHAVISEARQICAICMHDSLYSTSTAPFYSRDVILSHSVETHTFMHVRLLQLLRIFYPLIWAARSPQSVFIPRGRWVHRCVEIQITRRGVRESDGILMRRRRRGGGEKKHIQWHRFATFPQQLISLFIIHLWTFFFFFFFVNVDCTCEPGMTRWEQLPISNRTLWSPLTSEVQSAESFF